MFLITLTQTYCCFNISAFIFISHTHYSLNWLQNSRKLMFWFRAPSFNFVNIFTFHSYSRCDNDFKSRVIQVISIEMTLYYGLKSSLNTYSYLTLSYITTVQFVTIKNLISTQTVQVLCHPPYSSNNFPTNTSKSCT